MKITCAIFAMILVSAYAAEEEVEVTLSDNGKKFLWVAFMGLAIPTVYFAYKTFALPDGQRFYHIVTTFVCMFASLAYLTMATGHGVYIRPFDGREFFYARYIDWAFTTPLQLTDICGFGAADSDTMAWLLGIDFLMIIAGLIGAFLEGQEKWFFWGFGCLMFVPIVYYMLTTIKESEAYKAQPQWKKDVYGKISMLTAVSWACYPAVWMFAEGSNKLSADTEAVAYTILDILAKSVFGFIIVSAREGPETAPVASAPVASAPVSDAGGSML